jgi:hypothetical protein
LELATHEQNKQYDRHIDLGTDSFPIKVDNCASRTMSFNKRDLIPNTLKRVTSKGVRGFGNTVTPITHIGTIQWPVHNDEEMLHTIIIPNSYYVPNSSSRLLSPQHWAQQVVDTSTIKRGTWCATYDDSIVCHWDQQKYHMTIPLDPGSNNVGTIHTASGYEVALDSIEVTWQSAQEVALQSMVIMPEIIPDLYPPGLDDHGLPIEPINQNAPQFKPIDEDTDTTLAEPQEPDPEGVIDRDPERETLDQPSNILVLPTKQEID